MLIVEDVSAEVRELVDELVQARHPDSGSWLNATIVLTKGAKVTVKFTKTSEIVTVPSRNVRPATPARQGRC
jgi:hypothetical protein